MVTNIPRAYLGCRKPCETCLRNTKDCWSLEEIVLDRESEWQVSTFHHLFDAVVHQLHQMFESQVCSVLRLFLLKKYLDQLIEFSPEVTVEQEIR